MGHNELERTTSFLYTKTKILLPVKSYNLRSYLKVFTGIKKKKLTKKFFFAWVKIWSRTLKIFPIKWIFRWNLLKWFFTYSDDLRRRYVMPTYSRHIPKSKVWGYDLGLSWPSLFYLRPPKGKKQKKIICFSQGSNPALLHGSLLP